MEAQKLGAEQVLQISPSKGTWF